mgnify:CR=1 FL=1
MGITENSWLLFMGNPENKRQDSQADFVIKLSWQSQPSTIPTWRLSSENAMLPQLVTSPELPSSIYGVFPSDFRADNSIIHDFLQPFQGDFPHFPDIFWLVVQ